jgi:prepilin-type N-terminal cleavage/methylation domain-containing protein
MDVKRASGFTLIELLVVMAIIGVLAGIGIAFLPAMLRSGPKTAAQTFLKNLGAAIEIYRSSEGSYPPTSLEGFPGVGALANAENLGIESVVVCLNSTRYTGSFDFTETQGCKLENYDGDRTQTQVTRFGDNPEMFEAVDPWGTPYVYFNHQDYGRAEELGKVSGAEGVIKCLPYKDSKLKRFSRYDKFQLISAGPDRVFNTGDDITDFDRE